MFSEKGHAPLRTVLPWYRVDFQACQRNYKSHRESPEHIFAILFRSCHLPEAISSIMAKVGQNIHLQIPIWYILLFPFELTTAIFVSYILSNLRHKHCRRTSKMAKLICNWIFFPISTFSIIEQIASAKTPNLICKQVFSFQTTLTVNKVHEEAVRVINCTQGVEGGSYIKDHVKCWHSPPGIYIGLYDAHLIPLNAQPSFWGRTAAAAPLPCCRPERPRDWRPS